MSEKKRCNIENCGTESGLSVNHLLKARLLKGTRAIKNDGRCGFVRGGRRQ